MRHRRLIFLLFLWVSIVIISYFLVATAEVPIPLFSKPQRNLVWFLQPQDTLSTSMEVDKSVSSLRYFFYVDPQIDPFKYYIDVSAKIDGKDIYASSRRYPITRFLVNEEIRFPIPPRSQVLNQEVFIEFKTNAPQNALGLWLNSYSHNNVTSKKTFIKELAYMSYQKLSPGMLLNTIMLSSRRIIQIIGLAFLIFIIGISTIFALKQKNSKNDDYYLLTLPIGLCAFVISGFIELVWKSTFDHSNHSFIGRLIIIIVLLVGILKFYKSKTCFHLQCNYQNLSLLLIFVTSLLSTIIINNSNLIPPWVDGLKHQSIIRSLVQNTRSPIFSGYHLGFHFSVKTLLSLGLMEDYEISLLLGMTLGSFSGLAMYAFVKELRNDPQLALFSGLIFCVISPFPAYLQNWSRYPFLMSIILILPIFSLMIRALIHKNKISFPLIVLLIITAGLCHYSSIYLIGLFYLACVISNYINKSKDLHLLKTSKRALLILLVMFIIFVYIFLSIEQGNGFENLIQQRITDEENVWQIFGLSLKGAGEILIIGSFIYILLSGFRKPHHFDLSLVFIFLLIAGQILQKTFFDTFIFSLMNSMIILMMFASFFFSILLTQVIRYLSRKSNSLNIRFFIISLLIGFLGMWWSPVLIQPSNIKFNEKDAAAINWIEKNKLNSSFLINFMKWGDEKVPSDGGGWLNFMSNSYSVFPPDGINSDTMCEWIKENQVKYYYDGNGEKAIDYRSIDCIRFEPIFQDEVTIFKIN